MFLFNEMLGIEKKSSKNHSSILWSAYELPISSLLWNVTSLFFFFFFPQNAMNLPPDKARLLRQYDNEKKWELICDQVRNSDAFINK